MSHGQRLPEREPAGIGPDTNIASERVAETCSTLAPAGGTCRIRLTFTATKIGSLNGALTVFDGTDVAAVTLAGTGWTLL